MWKRLSLTLILCLALSAGVVSASGEAAVASIPNIGPGYYIGCSWTSGTNGKFGAGTLYANGVVAATSGLVPLVGSGGTWKSNPVAYSSGTQLEALCAVYDSQWIQQAWHVVFRTVQ